MRFTKYLMGDACEVDRPIRVKRYRFAPDLLERVWQCRRNDNYHGLFEWAEDWIVIALSACLSLLAWKHLFLIYSLPIYLVCLFLIGGRQRALADILHQAAHGTLLKNKRLGNFFGTFLSGYFVLQSLSGYRLSHVVRHHGFLGDPVLDPDYEQYRLWNICGKNLKSAAVRRHFLRTLLPGNTLAYLYYLVRHRILPAGEDWRERTIRVSLTAIFTLLICLLGYAPVLLLYWIVPLVTTQAWIGAFLELVEHYPMIETRQSLDIYMSRNRRCSWISSFLLGLKQYDGFHLVHHQFPFIPSWRLSEAHELLMEDPLYRSLNQVYGWKAIVQTILHPETGATTIHDSVITREVSQ